MTLSSKILLYISRHGPSSYLEVAKALKLDKRKVQVSILYLRSRGVLTNPVPLFTSELTMEPSDAASQIESDPKATAHQIKMAREFRLVEDKVGTIEWAEQAVKVIGCL